MATCNRAVPLLYYLRRAGWPGILEQEIALDGENRFEGWRIGGGTVTAQEVRCEVTRNLCGTDTWMAGFPCQCIPCQKYLYAFPFKERAEAAEARVKELERQAENERKIAQWEIEKRDATEAELAKLRAQCGEEAKP